LITSVTEHTAQLADKARRWGSKAGLSVTDQALVSGANFLLSVLLGRWLSATGYGAFAIAFSVFLFLSGFFSALLTDPMRVLAWRPSRQLAAYLHVLLRLQLVSGLTVAGLLLVAAGVARWGGSTLAPALLGLACAAPFVLLFQFFRMSCYLQTRPEWAVIHSAGYAALALGGLAALRAANWMTPFSAFLLMGVASAAAAASYFLFVFPRKSAEPATRMDTVPVVLREHWGFGKWLVASALVYWLSGAVYLPLLGGIVGLEAAGALRAMQNLVLPLEQIIVALGLLFVPWVARGRTERGLDFARGASRKICAVYASLSLVYLCFIVAAGRRGIDLLYGADGYGHYAWILPWLALASLLASTGHGLVVGLNAAEQPRGIFWSRTSSALVTVAIGLPLLSVWKLGGAVAGMVLAAAVALVSLWCWHRRIFATPANPR
jgi:O-antigen/teichoic acid export membrane protein